VNCSDAILRVTALIEELEGLEVSIWTSQFSAWQADAELTLRTLFGDKHPLTLRFIQSGSLFSIRTMSYDEGILHSSNWHAKSDFGNFFHVYRNETKGVLEAAIRHLQVLAAQTPSVQETVEHSDTERTPSEVSHAVNTRDVFVVHGRNLVVRDAVIDFLSAIDLHPIEWSEAVSGTGQPTPYVGDILDVAFGRAAAIVVLVTPEDEARLLPEFQESADPEYEKTLTPQARPNVIFEAGMAMGRDAKRTVLVQLGDVRPFSDVAGRHVLRLDNSVSKRQQLAERLRLAGCRVNTSGDRWHTAGDFERA
jgi:predicted nucleotide-binding protein